MIELPEALVLSGQLTETLRGKVITDVIVNYSPHKFAFFNGNPEAYSAMLSGKEITGAQARGGQVEICAGDMRIVMSDGANIQYIEPGGKLPLKHQLLVGFGDDSCIVVTIQMYGMLWAFRAGEFDHPYYLSSEKHPTALAEDFTYGYFMELVMGEDMLKKTVKGMLATEQSIPGLGNGVLQDILYNACLHPRRKVSTLTEVEIQRLFRSVKDTLSDMYRQGGRDTEKDLFGMKGKYITRLSKNTLGTTCSRCGGMILKESYMGGTVYYCNGCQKE